jgi:TM2 domain-containing membrane protein YozV
MVKGENKFEEEDEHNGGGWQSGEVRQLSEFASNERVIFANDPPREQQQQQQQQQQQFHVQTHGSFNEDIYSDSDADRLIDENNEIHFVSPSDARSLCLAYILWLPPFGLLGLHRLYMKQHAMCLYYLLTGGNFGLGWLFDAFRLPSLVRSFNASKDGRVPLHWYDTAVMSMPPIGILGGLRAHLGYSSHAFYYFLTAGGGALNYLLDFFMLPCLIDSERRRRELERRARGYAGAIGDEMAVYNAQQRCRIGVQVSHEVSVGQAYALVLNPITGLLGAHRAYIGHPILAAIYFFTGGLFTFGWLYDILTLWRTIDNDRRKLMDSRSPHLPHTVADHQLRHRHRPQHTIEHHELVISNGNAPQQFVEQHDMTMAPPAVIAMTHPNDTLEQHEAILYKPPTLQNAYVPALYPQGIDF